MLQFSARNRTFCVLVMTGLTAGCGDISRSVPSQAPATQQTGSQSPGVQSPGADRVEKQPIPGGVRPVTVERLTGAQLLEIGQEPAIVWDFTADRFELTIDGDPLPTDLLDSLLGEGEQSRRIVGAWKLSADGQALLISEIEAQPLPSDDLQSTVSTARGAAEVRLSLAPAGWVRANLGERQYNIRERMQRRLSREHALPGSGTVKHDATLPTTFGDATARPAQGDSEVTRSE